MSRFKPVWVAVLRPYNSDIETIGVLTLRELAETSRRLDLRMRYNPDMRLVTMRLPMGTRREQVFDAFDLLTADERSRLYNLPQHPMMAHAA